MRFRKTLVLLTALAGVGLAAPAQAADDVTWTVRTAANTYGADRSSFSYSVNAGGQIKDAMIVANRGKTPVTLAVYAADGFTTDTGQLNLLTAGEKSAGIGAWVRAEQTTLALKPGQTVEVPFALSVPANATPGDHVGGIITSLTQADSTQGINVDRRLAIKIKLRVGGELAPQLAVENLHTGYSGTANPFGSGDATVTYTVHNTGNTILSAQQAVSISGPFGWWPARAGDIPATPQLLPGESWQVSVPVHGVAPALSLATTVTLTPVLVDASGTTTLLDPIEATAHRAAIPWTLLALIVALAAAVVGTILLRRRTRAHRKDREDARVREAVEQALSAERTKGRGPVRPGRA